MALSRLQRVLAAAVECAAIFSAPPLIVAACMIFDPEVKPMHHAARAQKLTPAVSSPAGRLAGVARQTDDAGPFFHPSQPDQIARLIEENRP